MSNPSESSVSYPISLLAPRLPYDIIDEIGFNLRTDQGTYDTKTLSAISAVSRHFLHIARKIRFMDIQITFISIPSFLELLHAGEDIVKYIRSLTMTLESQSYTEGYGPNRLLSWCQLEDGQSVSTLLSLLQATLRELTVKGDGSSDYELLPRCGWDGRPQRLVDGIQSLLLGGCLEKLHIYGFMAWYLTD